MNEGMLALSIPIIGIIVGALIAITAIYFKSRERQSLIEKGLSPEVIREFFEAKKDPNRLLKYGIIIFAFGLGLGLGIMLEDYTSKEYWIPLFLFTFTGIGFVVSSLVSRKLDVKN
jgi:predicted histidine transporter YuiF (NhaC family)